MSTDPTRRDVLGAGGLLLASVLIPTPAGAHDGVFDIGMRSDIDGTRVWFDPIGLLVPLNATLRWTVLESVHTATAYHPDNDNHALRIPEEAAPWDSDYLVNPGDTFEVTLTQPGVYDYYCAPHEFGGMVGRIIVQEATGPGTAPFDYFKSQTPALDWQAVPDMAQASFPSIDSILAKGRVYVEP